MLTKKRSKTWSKSTRETKKSQAENTYTATYNADGAKAPISLEVCARSIPDVQQKVSDAYTS